MTERRARITLRVQEGFARLLSLARPYDVALASIRIVCTNTVMDGHRVFCEEIILSVPAVMKRQWATPEDEEDDLDDDKRAETELLGRMIRVAEVKGFALPGWLINETPLEPHERWRDRQF